MSKTPDTIVDDIYRTVVEGVEVEPGLVEQFGKTLSTLLADRIKPREPRKFTLRMSNLGKGDRALWYDKHLGATETFSGHTLIKFMFGELVEQMVLFLAAASGHKVTRQQQEVELDGIVGHIDANIDGTTIDVKSASTYAFRKFKDGTLPDNDSFGYMEQLAGYATAEDTDGGFLAVDKQNGHIAYLPYSKEDLGGLRIRDRIDHIKKVVDSPEIPPRCYKDKEDGASGNRVLDVNCSYCPFKFECWKESNGGIGLRTFLYSDGPRHFTSVQREPKVHEVTF